MDQLLDLDLSLSHTAKITYQTCHRKYYLRYLKRLKKVGLSKPLRMGSAFSLALEHWDASKVVEWYEEYFATSQGEGHLANALEKDIVWLMADGYMSTYEQHERERELKPIEFGHGTFVGYIDGVIDRYTLVEDKLKGMWTANDVTALDIDDQITGYIYAYCREAGIPPDMVVVKYRVTRKPGLRQKKTEHESEFFARIQQDLIERPDHYFIEVEQRRTQKQLDDWVNDMMGTAFHLGHSVTSGEWPRSTGACKQFGGLCDMWDICTARDDTELEGVINDLYEIRER